MRPALRGVAEIIRAQLLGKEDRRAAALPPCGQLLRCERRSLAAAAGENEVHRKALTVERDALRAVARGGVREPFTQRPAGKRGADEHARLGYGKALWHIEPPSALREHRAEPREKGKTILPRASLKIREHAAEAARMALAEDGAAEHGQLRQRTVAAVGETEQAALSSDAAQAIYDKIPAVADGVSDVDERHTVAAAACGLRRRDREKDRHRRYPLAENGKNW